MKVDRLISVRFLFFFNPSHPVHFRKLKALKVFIKPLETPQNYFFLFVRDWVTKEYLNIGQRGSSMQVQDLPQNYHLIWCEINREVHYRET